jgi:hypothetical protein
LTIDNLYVFKDNKDNKDNVAYILKFKTNELIVRTNLNKPMRFTIPNFSNIEELVEITNTLILFQ